MKEKRQQEIDWNADSSRHIKRQMLRELRPACGCEIKLGPDGKRRRGCQCRSALQSLLIRLDDHQRQGEYCYPAVETLATGLACSVRTAQRWLRLAERSGYIETWSRFRTKDVKRSTNGYRIIWLKIWNETRELQPSESGSESPHGRGDSLPRKGCQNAPFAGPRRGVNLSPDGCQNVTVEGCQIVTQNLNALKPIETIPPSSTSSSPPKQPLHRDPVVEAVEGAGVADAQTAVTKARGRGLTDAAILSLVAEFVAAPGRWGEGALHARLTRLGKWPPDSPLWLATQARASVNTSEGELPDLEADYGEQLDALDAAEFAGLLQRFTRRTRADMERSHDLRMDGRYRLLLLQALSKASSPIGAQHAAADCDPSIPLARG